MDTSPERISALIANPSESLNIELKRWIDPTTPHGKAKIAIGCMALRNRNGGYLIIGIDDRTRQLDPEIPPDIEKRFHPDVIQKIVSDFASNLFEVKVAFGKLDGIEIPVIAVEEGVRVPVAAKRELVEGGKHLIRQDAVYFRTLRSSGIVGSSAATHGDWADILDVCFDNREADIGRFLRRHFGTSTALLETLKGQGGAPDSPKERLQATLRAGDEKRLDAFGSDEFSRTFQEYADLGAWTATLVFDPPLPADDSDRTFLRTIATANPRYTGWPAWLDTDGVSDATKRPRKKNGGWETVLLSGDDSWAKHADFQWVSAKGEFYLWRVYQDDLTDKVAPKTAIDFGLLTYRIAEVIAVGLAFAKALQVPPETQLHFVFRLDDLSGRSARSWASPRRTLPVYGKAYDDVAEGFTSLSSDTAVSAIAPFVHQALAPIAGVFDGSEIPPSLIEPFVEGMLSREF